MGKGELERREYFRIKDVLPFYFRVITEEEFTKLKKIIKYANTTLVEELDQVGILADKISQKIEEGNELFLFLSLIDRKLNLIMEHILTIEDMKKNCGMEYREVEISASGVKFSTEQALQVGDLVELKIVLPLFSFPKIHALSQVVRTGEEAMNGERKRYVALKFMEINDNDRELLMKYMFKVERERIRSERRNI